MLFGNPCKFPCLCALLLSSQHSLEGNCFLTRKNLLEVTFPMGSWPHQLQHIVTKPLSILVLIVKRTSDQHSGLVP